MRACWDGVIMTPFREHPLPRYVFAVFCTGIATIVALVTRQFFAHGTLSFYLIAVMTAAWVGGRWPGLLATFCSVLSIDYFFLIPTQSLAVQSADDIAEMIVFSLVAVTVSFLQTAQKRARSALETLNQKLEERVKERTAWLSLVYDITGAANETETVDQAFRFALRRITSDPLWHYAQILTPREDASEILSPSHVQAVSDDPELMKLQDGASGIRIRRGEGTAGRVWDSGTVAWVKDVAGEPEAASKDFVKAGLKSAVLFPVVVGKKVVAVVECFSRDRIEPDQQLTDLMGAVGIELGLSVERKQLQEGYTEAVWQQQRRTAQELHDDLGQSLTGLWLLGTSLTEKLKETDHAPLARKLADGIEKSLEQIRAIAKGVFPVDLDSQGLMAALQELANVMGSASGVACRFECPDPVLLEDNRVAIHLYRIAQEAITNALRHGKPQEVVVSLHPTEEGIQLRITDDGSGILGPSERKEGAGLRIMRYRAAAIDAKLRVESNGGRGTLVTCLSHRAHRG